MHIIRISIVECIKHEKIIVFLCNTEFISKC